jgi:hypothetical protein
MTIPRFDKQKSPFRGSKVHHRQSNESCQEPPQNSSPPENISLRRPADAFLVKKCIKIPASQKAGFLQSEKYETRFFRIDDKFTERLFLIPSEIQKRRARQKRTKSGHSALPRSASGSSRQMRKTPSRIRRGSFSARDIIRSLAIYGVGPVRGEAFGSAEAAGQRLARASSAGQFRQQNYS